MTLPIVLGSDRELVGCMQPMIQIGDKLGFVFEGESVGSFAFVPEECVILKADGAVGIDEMEYLTSGWGQRNSRFNTAETSGNHLFPVIEKWVTDPAWPSARLFVDRLREAYASKAP